MKNNIILISIYIVFIFSLNSCAKDDDYGYTKLNEQENLITFKIFSNTADALINTQSLSGEALTIKKYWESSCKSKHWSTQLSANCDNDTVLITGEIHINNELKLRSDANRKLNMYVKIKEL